MVKCANCAVLEEQGYVVASAARAEVEIAAAIRARGGKPNG